MGWGEKDQRIFLRNYEKRPDINIFNNGTANNNGTTKIIYEANRGFAGKWNCSWKSPHFRNKTRHENIIKEYFKIDEDKNTLSFFTDVWTPVTHAAPCLIVKDDAHW